MLDALADLTVAALPLPGDELQLPAPRILARITGIQSWTANAALYSWELAVPLTYPNPQFKRDLNRFSGNWTKGFPAWEATNNVRVPVDGSAVVELQWSAGGLYLSFSYPEPGMPARITSSAGLPHGWQEITFNPLGASQDLFDGRSGTTAVNPAYALSGTSDVPAGTRVWMVRGYGAAPDVVTEIAVHGDNISIHQVQVIYLTNAVGGSWTLTLTNDSGVQWSTEPLGHDATAGDVQAAIRAVAGFESVIVGGAGTFTNPFFVVMFDTFADLPVGVGDPFGLIGVQEWWFLCGGCGAVGSTGSTGSDGSGSTGSTGSGGSGSLGSVSVSGGGSGVSNPCCDGVAISDSLCITLVGIGLPEGVSGLPITIGKTSAAAPTRVWQGMTVCTVTNCTINSTSHLHFAVQLSCNGLQYHEWLLEAFLTHTYKLPGEDFDSLGFQKWVNAPPTGACDEIDMQVIGAAFVICGPPFSATKTVHSYNGHPIAVTITDGACAGPAGQPGDCAIGSGPGSVSLSGGSGSGGGGLCCSGLPLTLFVTFGGSLAPLGSIALTATSSLGPWSAGGNTPCGRIDIGLWCDYVTGEYLLAGLLVDNFGFAYGAFSVRALPSSCSPFAASWASDTTFNGGGTPLCPLGAFTATGSE